MLFFPSRRAVPRWPILSLILVLHVLLDGAAAWTCETSCGGIPLNYPFGYGWDCGSSSFQPYVNCSNNRLLFYTPTGTYNVQSIDYANGIMIVVDPHMSSCSAMRLSGSFGLPVGAPFSFSSYNTIALIGCSSTSILYSKKSCDSSMHSVCDSLYGCSAISQVGIVPNSASSSCCILSNSALSNAPYQIDLPLLQCATYSSIYRIGNIQDPESSWLYGIALKFDAGYSPPNNTGGGSGGGSHPYCYTCEVAEEAGASVNSLPSMVKLAGIMIVLLEVFRSLL
ncbi:hypothetical protein KP509_04G001200 [Ceratopteris richardii]|uniref:Wall-associated receptor kinase galacturonan-binding domain-containing protein n=1 Tax=Ceratopteris richardii TaxID=49495 RepID=A0A8T2UTN3_CERRI|nr:hypothetical protein KP509_04G001200 [Ceratopteris richardii]